MRYQKCKYWDEGYCYNQGLRNGLNSLECVGYDRCAVYKDVYNIEDVPQSESDETHCGEGSHKENDSSQSGPHKVGQTRMSRRDIVGQNGNDGQVYIVEKIARAIAGDEADQPLGGRLVGNDRWTLSIGAATRVYIALWEDLKESL